MYTRGHQLMASRCLIAVLILAQMTSGKLIPQKRSILDGMLGEEGLGKQSQVQLSEENSENSRKLGKDLDPTTDLKRIKSETSDEKVTHGNYKCRIVVKRCDMNDYYLYKFGEEKKKIEVNDEISSRIFAILSALQNYRNTHQMELNPQRLLDSSRVRQSEIRSPMVRRSLGDYDHTVSGVLPPWTEICRLLGRSDCGRFVRRRSY